MSRVQTKQIRCRKCQFEITLVTKTDDDGFHSHRGWGALAEHYQREHQADAAKLAEWIYAGTSYKLPFDAAERELQKAEERCGTEVDAAA